MDPSHFHPYALPVTAAAPPPVYLPPPAREVPFRFTGNAKDYFRIWIINVALTLVTLGVYSAWAKVRTKQYFYRNTWLEDNSFEYLADPIRILKGRVIMAVALGLLFGAQYYSLPLYLVLLGLMVLATPLVVVKSLAFNARNSAYRNIRFSFMGNAGEAFGIYLQMVLVYAGTCGMGYPYAQWRLTDFVVQRHLYGDERFTWSTKSHEYFAIFLMAMLVSVPVYAVAVGLMVGMTVLEGSESEAALLPLGLFYAGSLVPAGYVRAKMANALYSGVSIGPHRLVSDQRPWDVIKLYVTNALAIIGSLGLLVPWAKVRLARYRAEHLKLVAVGPLRAGSYDLAGHASAVGDAAQDLGDFDLDVGL